MLELMIQFAADDIGLRGEALIISDFAGCMRGIYGMIIDMEDFDDPAIDAISGFARMIDEALFWEGARSPGEQLIEEKLIFWLGDIL